MINSSNTISKKIALLNETTTASLLEGSVISLIRNFTEVSIKILEADFGFAWCRFNENEPSKLMYKSSAAPRNPVIPARKKSEGEIEDILFDNNVGQGAYESIIESHFKSYIIIRLNSGEHVYGCIVIGYKKKHVFNEEELSLAKTIGNIVVQAITINWLIEKEYRIINLVEKQKEIEILLGQEKLKTEFIANATHELRTPLAIMKGNVDLALMSKGDAQAFRSALSEVSVEINILAEILKDMALLTSREENIKQAINTKPFHIGDLVSQTVERLRPIGKKKNITIDIKAGRFADLCVLVDKKYLDKLFLNIIKNAITYGRKAGYIEIDISKDKEMVKIQIKDNGVGISKEDLPKIFERFYRADKAHSSYGNHSGLGLAIAKWVVEIHKGEISAESVYGKGSTFTVRLPICKP